MDSVREGEGEKIWENGIETCKISCMKRVASPGSMHDTGCLGLVHWDDPEGWYGKGGGRRDQCMKVKSESEVAQSCPTLSDPMDCSSPGFFVPHHLPEFAQTHVHQVGDAIQPPSSLPVPSLWVIPVHQPQASCILHRTWTGDSFHI